MTHLSVCSLFHTLLSFIRQMAFRLVARDSPSIYRSFIYSLRFFIGDFFFLFFPLFFGGFGLFGFVCFPDRHWGVLERVVLFISSKIGYFLASLPHLFIQYLLGLGPVVRIGQGKVSVGCFFGPFFWSLYYLGNLEVYSRKFLIERNLHWHFYFSAFTLK